MFKLPVQRVFVFAWLLLSVAEWSSADPCTELDRAIDVLIPAVRNSGKQIDQALQSGDFITRGYVWFCTLLHSCGCFQLSCV